jgi:hypothetical protein
VLPFGALFLPRSCEYLMVRSRASFLAVLAVAALVAGCGSDTPIDTGLSSTPPSPTTETFSGEGLNPNGARVHPFAVQAPGTVTATLTALVPNSTVLIGLGLGTWNGVACNITLVNDSAFEGFTLTATASTAGNLCLRLFDNGRLVQPASYQVTVTHF